MARDLDRRSFLIAAGGIAVAAGRPLMAQTGSRSPQRVGYLGGADTSLLSAFEEAMRSLGYVGGQNLLLTTRLIQPNAPDAPRFAAELAQLDLDVVVAVALPHALALRAANFTRPLVIATCPGMVSNGFAASLDRPGGNATGIDELPPGVTAKRLRLLKTAVPRVSKVALLSTTPGRGGHEAQLEDAGRVASVLAVSVKPYRAATLRELDTALTAIADDHMDGLVNFQGGLSLINRQVIVDFAAARRLPAIYQATMFAEAGGMMAWAPDLVEQHRVAARYVDQILKGANPGELPIRYPSGYFLTVNTRATNALGLVLPPALQVQVDRVVS